MTGHAVGRSLDRHSRRSDASCPLPHDGNVPRPVEGWARDTSSEGPCPPVTRDTLDVVSGLKGGKYVVLRGAFRLGAEARVRASGRAVGRSGVLGCGSDVTGVAGAPRQPGLLTWFDGSPARRRTWSPGHCLP